MNFDKFIKQYISEAAGDIPPNIREFGGTGLTSSGALGFFLAKRDIEQLSAARGKAREEEGGETFRKKLLGYKAAIAEGYKRLKNENFTPKDDYEKQAVEEFKTWGLGEEPAEVLYVLGGKIAKNLWSLNNLNASPKDKKIPIINENGEKVAEVTIQSVAREALDKFYELFKENAKKGPDNKFRWPELSSSLYMDDKDGPIVFQRGYGEGEETETTKIDPKRRGRLAFKQLVDVLRTFAPKGSKLLEKNKMFDWSLTTRQIQGSNNYFALDARSTPDHWYIYINKKGEGKEEGGKLRTIYGSIDDKSKKYRLQKTEDLPLKFEKGVPKYGVRITEKETYTNLNDFLNLVGYDTIYDVLYAKYVKKDKKFKMPDGKVIDLEKLKVTEYRLTVPSVERRAREEKVAKTGLRPEDRPKPMGESLEATYEKLLIKE
jgi:hypothetical protein